jgi:hypothetical protein
MAQRELDEAFQRADHYVPVIENYVDLWKRMTGDSTARLIRLAATQMAQVNVLSRELARARAELTRLKKGKGDNA